MKRRLNRTTRLRDIITFWALIAVCAVILFVLTFMAGKYWVGGLMARSHSTQTTPQVVLNTPGEGDDAKGPDGEQGPERVEPPSNAVVKVQQRAPTDAEKNEIEQQYPQDAAGLHQAGGKDPDDESTGADDKPLGDAEGADSQGRYLVAAGAYADPVNAQRVLDTLRNLGYSAHLVEIERKGQTLQRVVAGRYAERARAEEVQAQLQSQGQEATVIAQ
jgi:DedD protein